VLPAAVPGSEGLAQQAFGAAVYTPRLAAPSTPCLAAASQGQAPSLAAVPCASLQAKCESALSLLGDQCTRDQERLSETLELEKQLSILNKQCITERTLRMNAEFELERRVASDNDNEKRLATEPELSAQENTECLALKEQLCILGDECIRQRGLRINAETELIQMMQVIESLQQQLGQAQSDNELMKQELEQAHTENELMEARVFASHLAPPLTESDPETRHPLQTHCQEMGGNFGTEVRVNYQNLGGIIETEIQGHYQDIGGDIETEIEELCHLVAMGGNIE